MRILVTGGSGFIGTHLCRSLLAEGHSVRILDLRASPLGSVDGLEIWQGDVRDQKLLDRALSEVEVVFHFAAMVSIPLCQQQPLESTETNLLATLQLLDSVAEEQSRRASPIKLVFSGSSVVYGDQTRKGERRTEADLLGPPLSFYGAQKLGAEQYIRLYSTQHGIPAVSFRFFNVYGPGQDPNSPYSGVISIFSSAIREGKALKLNGGGAQTRDFVSVHDVVRAGLLALQLPNDQADGIPINLATARSLSIRELAEAMVKVSGSQVALEDAPARQGDVQHSGASIERAKAILKWEPQVSLGEGLAELL